MKLFRLLAPTLLLGGLTGCPRESQPLTAGEAREALDEAAFASEAEALTAEEVEIGTDFTLGAGARKAAENLRDFYRSQAPCAEVTLDAAVLTIDYGVAEGCVWRGRTFHGQHVIEIVQADATGIEVDHGWIGFTNGKVVLDGTATVTWSLANQSRTVRHDLVWTRGDKQASGTGERTQALLDPALGLAGGITVNGNRSWTGPKGGTWDLAVIGVEARPQDPVPQAGSYQLSTPGGKNIGIAFERVDAARIRVTLSSGEKTFGFVVLANGAVEPA